MLRFPLRAQHSGDQAKVGGQAVVEAVDQIAEQAARPVLCQGSPRGSAQPGKRSCMLRRLTGQAQRCTAGILLGALVREPEIALYLTSLFFEQHREEEAWSKPPSCPTHHPGPARGSNGGDWVAVVFQQFVPNRYVSILDGG
jgi:hypothetical protein